MPIYEYDCNDCDNTVEALQRLSDPPLTVCPECGGELKKRLSAPAFQFKGSGWYVTDYANKDGDRKSKEGDDKKAASSSDSGAGDSTSSKTDSTKSSDTKSSASKKKAAKGD